MQCGQWGDDRSHWDRTALSEFGGASADYQSTVTFFDPFSVYDNFAVDNPQDYEVEAVVGTDDIGLLKVTPRLSTSTPPGLASAVVGYCYATGQALWSATYSEFGDNNPLHAYINTFSNGVDRVAVAVGTSLGPHAAVFFLQTLDARTGQVMSSATFNDRVSVLAMAEQTIVIEALNSSYDYTVTGCMVDDLSTQVWQSPGRFDRSVIGQWVLTSEGYVEIVDHYPTGFGSDTGPTLKYQEIDGVVFQWRKCRAVGGCFQQYDVATRQVVGGPPIPQTIEFTEYDRRIVVADQMMVTNCGGEDNKEICGYRLSDGQVAWKVDGGAEAGARARVGEYVLIDNRDMDINRQPFFARISDGQNQIPIPSLLTSQLVHGETILYKFDDIYSDQAIVAYDSTNNFSMIWTTQMPARGKLMIASNHLIYAGADGRVWVAHPPKMS